MSRDQKILSKAVHLFDPFFASLSAVEIIMDVKAAIKPKAFFTERQLEEQREKGEDGPRREIKEPARPLNKILEGQNTLSQRNLLFECLTLLFKENKAKAEQQWVEDHKHRELSLPSHLNF